MSIEATRLANYLGIFKYAMCRYAVERWYWNLKTNCVVKGEMVTDSDDGSEVGQDEVEVLA